MTATKPADLIDQMRHLETLGWAFTHAEARDAYRRATGEDITPSLDRYRGWLEENLLGGDA
ncbi:hypothetical protein [Rhizobium sp. RAF56]|uniref:hypothetical protein n=1 Tax=Rhizobium sp. RAF56 TaxID=3233062 RepID=UPI003F9585A3